MNRFQKGRPGRALLRGLLPAAFFAVVLGLFIAGLDDISGMTAREEAEAKRRAEKEAKNAKSEAPKSEEAPAPEEKPEEKSEEKPEEAPEAPASGDQD